MALAFGPIVSGPYTATWNSVAVGFTVEGYRLSVNFLKEFIDQTDLFGRTMIESIHQGANAQLQYDSRCYDAGNLGPAFPYGGIGIIMSTTKPIGYGDRTHANAFVLTATANTPAAAAPATLTASKAHIRPDYPIELLFDSKARIVPIQLSLYPFEDGSAAGTMRHLSVT